MARMVVMAVVVQVGGTGTHPPVRAMIRSDQEIRGVPCVVAAAVVARSEEGAWEGWEADRQILFRALGMAISSEGEKNLLSWNSEGSSS